MKLQGRLFFVIMAIAATGILPGEETAKMPDPVLQEENLTAGMHQISSLTLYNYVKDLSSDKYDGRLTGTAGFDKAAQWAADLLKGGASNRGDSGAYAQSFANPYTLVLPGNEFSLEIKLENGEVIKKPYMFEADYFPGSTSDSGNLTAEVVYAGYGITAPELNFDEYKGIDVKEIGPVEPEVPVSPDREADEFKRWRPYSFHDYKTKNAKSHGAAGMIYNYHIANPNCVFIKDFLLTYVSPEVVNDVFLGTGKKHDALLERIRSSKEVVSFATGKSATIKNTTEYHPEGTAANVIGILEGKGPRPERRSHHRRRPPGWIRQESRTDAGRKRQCLGGRRHTRGRGSARKIPNCAQTFGDIHPFRRGGTGGEGLRILCRASVDRQR